MPRLEYREPEPLARAAAERALASSDAAVVCDALVGATLHDPDRAWVETWLARLVRHPAEDVRGLAATCIGHVARIHGGVDRALAGRVLDELAVEPALARRVASARADLRTYVRRR